LISGTVTPGLLAVVQLPVFGPGAERQDLWVTVDTGFDGTLMLPPAVITALNLDPLVQAPFILADNSRRTLPAYQGFIQWQGQLIRVRVLEVEAPPLIGTALLRGCRLEIEFRDGGAVQITPLHEPSEAPNGC
jgi:clan AA aspartic protease